MMATLATASVSGPEAKDENTQNTVDTVTMILLTMAVIGLIHCAKQIANTICKARKVRTAGTQTEGSETWGNVAAVNDELRMERASRMQAEQAVRRLQELREHSVPSPMFASVFHTQNGLCWHADRACLVARAHSEILQKRPCEICSHRLFDRL